MRQHRPCFGRHAASLLMHAVPIPSSDEVFMLWIAVPCASAPRAARLLLGVLGALAISGCATLTPDGGFDAVRTITKERAGYEARWARSEADSEAIRTMVDEILTRPLAVDDAVRIALINNRGLQATYAEVGIGEAELVQASRPSMPGFA